MERLYKNNNFGLNHLPERKLHQHGRLFDGKQVPTSARGKNERRLQNPVYKQAELLLGRWLHKPWE